MKEAWTVPKLKRKEEKNFKRMKKGWRGGGKKGKKDGSGTWEEERKDRNEEKENKG